MSPFFRRAKPLHERLADQGGLDLVPGERPAHDIRPVWLDAGIHGHQRPPEYDATRTVEARAPGEAFRFVVLEEELLVEEGGDVPDALAEAFDDALEPPYRVVARRVGEARWAAGASRIAVIRMGDRLEDVVDVARVGTEWTGPYVPELDELLPGDGAVHAERLDGDLWEVQVARL